MKAIALLEGDGISGTVKFTQQGNSALIVCDLSGVPDGPHGFHIHQFGDRSRGCESMGEHYSIKPSHHGGRSSRERHTGDLGNVISRDGLVQVRFYAKLEIQDILGRGLVLHADQDDLGRGSFADSKTTGHSGKRIACGVIALSK